MRAGRLRRPFCSQAGRAALPLLTLTLTGWIAVASPADGQVPAATAGAVTTSAAATITAKAAQPLGTLVIAGGALRFDNEAIWSRIVRSATEYARGKTAPMTVAAVRPARGMDLRPRIAVFATASGDPQRAGQRIIDALEKYGAAGFLVPVAIDKLPVDYHQAVNDAQLAAQVEAAHGVFFCGGSQSRLLTALRAADGKPTPVLTAVGRVYARGGVVAGTSAGAAVMSHVMCRDAKYLLQVLRNGVTKGKEVDEGFGFLDANWFVDQHFLVRGRIARALVIMRQFGVRYGLGIDEETAVVVRGGQAEVVGQRGAMLIDLSRATQDPKLAGFNVSDARVSYLDGGDSVDLASLRVTPAADKLAEQAIDPASPAFHPTTNEPIVANDILANSTLFDVMKRLMDNRPPDALGLAFDGSAAKTGPTLGFEFHISRAPGTVAWASSKSGAEDWTITGIRLDVRPVTTRWPIVGSGK
jgi:cyanophycinase